MFVKMYYPDLEQFKELSGKGNLIPVYKEILADMETPVSAYMKVAGQDSFLFESVEGGEKWARYSFIGFSPTKVIKSWGNDMEITRQQQPPIRKRVDDPLDALKQEMAPYKGVEVEGLPRFFGGLVGYIGYESVRFFEKVTPTDKPSLVLPDIYMMKMDTLLIFDHRRHVIKVVANAYIDDNTTVEAAYADAVSKIDALVRLLKEPHKADRFGVSKDPSETTYTSSFTREGFMGVVDRAKEYIKAGDAFQIVLSQRFETSANVDPFTVYRALRVINPSPYMFYLNMDGFKVAGSSPEILVRLDSDRIVLRPIAGTRKRGATEDEDVALEKELLADPKECAEHLMLVDLGRNDVGRVARIGSVEVTDFMTIERYSHVMHIVSNVEGALKDGHDAFDVLRACFPAGTVSGAPKVRAMEIIDELEPVTRGLYAGSVGYFSFTGDMDMCITIRTVVAIDGKIYVQAGAGIVADSVPEMEHNECVNKAMGMFKAVIMAKNGLE
ncbi:anthranilate synthase subunit I [Candidatus Magnetobacterium bavaricum]|uniref:Anthranilate synthase component 1 n=1 Tax=Candidatus Magnetobacterium bavaricum TaxID=29290 RepID=A0A0F3GS96_9BACT|nr:anthranilate synthase subunit I [Candidatus Magnetobacterium bavaricum]